MTKPQTFSKEKVKITKIKIFQETILTISCRVIIYVQACVLHKSVYDSNDSDFQNRSLAPNSGNQPQIDCQYLARTPSI